MKENRLTLLLEHTTQNKGFAFPFNADDATFDEATLMVTLFGMGTFDFEGMKAFVEGGEFGGVVLWVVVVGWRGLLLDEILGSDTERWANLGSTLDEKFVVGGGSRAANRGSELGPGRAASLGSEDTGAGRVDRGSALDDDEDELADGYIPARGSPGAKEPKEEVFEGWFMFGVATGA